MLSKKIVRFLKSGFLVISIGFSMGISGCKGNTEEPVSSEPIEIVSEKGMDDNFINIPIDIYAEATTKNKLKDMETVRKSGRIFGLPFTDRKRSGSCEKMLLRIQRWDYEK